MVSGELNGKRESTALEGKKPDEQHVTPSEQLKPDQQGRFAFKT